MAGRRAEEVAGAWHCSRSAKAFVFHVLLPRGRKEAAASHRIAWTMAQCGNVAMWQKRRVFVSVPEDSAAQRQSPSANAACNFCLEFATRNVAKS